MCVCVCVCARLVAQVLSNPLWPHGLFFKAPLSMGLLQERILQWVAMLSSRGSSQIRDRTKSAALQVDSLPSEALGSLRILEWVVYPPSRGTSQHRNRTEISCIAGRFFTSWATREARPLCEQVEFNVAAAYTGSLSTGYIVHYDIQCLATQKKNLRLIFMKMDAFLDKQ